MVIRLLAIHTYIHIHGSIDNAPKCQPVNLMVKFNLHFFGGNEPNLSLNLEIT